MADVKARVDVVQVIRERGVRLTHRGRYWWGRCPFHDDRGRPNFCVDPVAQTWTCWVCDARGDAIDFVARVERISLAEALKKLGDDEPGQVAVRPVPPTPVAIAPISVRHQVYTTLLQAAGLSEAHEEQLLGRGLTAEHIQAGQYATLPAKSARQALIQEVLRKVGAPRLVPGFALNQRIGQWDLWGQGG